MTNPSDIVLLLAETDRAAAAARAPHDAFIIMAVALAVAALIATRGLLRSKTRLMRLVWIAVFVIIAAIYIVMLVSFTQ